MNIIHVMFHNFIYSDPGRSSCSGASCIEICIFQIISRECNCRVLSFQHNFGYDIMRYRYSSLSGMPRMFWDPGFRLSHPDTFTQVFPFFTTKSAAIKSDNSSPTHATSSSSKLVQERLAHHLDLVEVDIADQVAQKSHHFFEVRNV